MFGCPFFFVCTERAEPFNPKAHFDAVTYTGYFWKYQNTDLFNVQSNGVSGRSSLKWNTNERNVLRF